MAVGRISGPLLKDNLLRNGVNLAFETSLLYLDVVNSRIGVNTAAPSNDLQVVGTTRTTNLTATNQGSIASFTISGNTISSTNSQINLLPASGGVVYQGSFTTGNFSITNNTITTTGADTDLNISPNGTGKVQINSNVLVNGNLHATGTITADGNINLGTSPSNLITFNGEVDSDIIPNITSIYDLGTPSLRWNTLYTANLVTNNINTSALNVTAVSTLGMTITGNSMFANTPNGNINLVTTGTGAVTIDNFSFYNNVITNTVADSPTVFTNTGNGYVVFAGSNGVVIPSGTTAQQPQAGFRQVGMVRYNTDLQYVEVWNGSVWQDASGSGGVSYQTAEEIGIVSALIFG
jgi:hypothetical protein